MDLHISLLYDVINSSWETPRRRITSSNGISIFRFFSRISTITSIVTSNLHSYQKCKRISFSPQFHQLLWLIDIFMAVIFFWSKMDSQVSFSFAFLEWTRMLKFLYIYWSFEFLHLISVCSFQIPMHYLGF